MVTLVRLTLAAATLLLIVGGVAHGAVSAPTAQVKTAVDSILLILQDKSLDTESRWQRIGRIIDDRFDFQSMSQSVLATNWQKATPEEKQQFVTFFSQYLEDTYRVRIESYAGQQVKYLDEKVQGDRAVVKTVIVSGATEIPVDYKLRRTGEEWLGYDVVIEGVSLVSNYRNTFAAIVKTEGMDGLLNDLQQRILKRRRTDSGTP